MNKQQNNGVKLVLIRNKITKKIQFYKLSRHTTSSNIEPEIHLPIKEFSNADFPASLGPKTKHWKTFLSDCRFLQFKCLLLVTRIAEEGSPVNPMHIRFSTLRIGSRSVIRAHCSEPHICHKIKRYVARKTQIYVHMCVYISTATNTLKSII